MKGKDKEGIAFGEAVVISSPPNRSQIEGNPESGFGGWADEKIKNSPRSGSAIRSEKISSTTFDNISIHGAAVVV